MEVTNNTRATAQFHTSAAMITENDVVSNALDKVLQELTQDNMAGAPRLEELRKIWIVRIRKFLK